MRKSVLDDLGEEVTGIVAPVSLCMALTVALVRILNPEGESNSGAVFLASAYYSEDEGDSTGQKLSGALLNALIFIGVVALMTFILVLLFKYGCVKVIYAYMGLAGFSIFFVLTGIIALELLQKWDVHMDWVSFTYILYNFAMVGSVTLFFFPAPLLMKQCYLILTGKPCGVVTAYVFTWIPPWTTWVLLVAMAVYDVLAVLVPGGPLKMLVELAQEREETIPALVYEARPVRRDNSQHARAAADAEEGPVGLAAGEDGAAAPPTLQQMAAAPQRQVELPSLQRAIAPGLEQQQQQLAPSGGPASIGRASIGTASVGGSSTRDLDVSADTPLIRTSTSGGRPLSAPALGATEGREAAQRSGRSAPGAAGQAAGAGELQPSPPPGGAGPAGGPEGGGEDEDDGMFELPEAIKLGLGDFIFYSVLVGRAAMYDFLTVFACYLAIIAGLGCTLLWLALARKALPALPISITLAVAFYFISRFVMEPVVLPMVLELAYF